MEPFYVTRVVQWSRNAYLTMMMLFLVGNYRSHWIDRMIVSSRYQSLCEIVYDGIVIAIHESVWEGEEYVPFLLRVMGFLMLLNMAGMIPYVFSVTSHIMTRVGLSMRIWWRCVIIGKVKQGMKDVSMFTPV